MPNFVPKFDAPPGAEAGDQHELDAQTLEEAKVMAAVLYAGASFKLTPPTSYRIVGVGGAELYHFPETR